MSQSNTVGFAGLLRVNGIEPGHTMTTIACEGERMAYLPHSHRDYEYLLELAHRSLSRRHPTGFLLSTTNEVLDMKNANNDFVQEITERDAESYQVLFQGLDGVYTLRRERSGFDRILEALTISLREKERVWFIVRYSNLELLDVKLDRNYS